MSTADDGLLTIDPLYIQGEFVRIAADLAHWSEQFAESTRAFRKAEHQLETIKAHVYLHVRMMADSAGMKLTEAMVASQVCLDGKVSAAVTAHIDAEAEMLRVKGVVQALITKRDMLISLGAHIREEMKGDPTIKQSSHTKLDWNKNNE